MTKVTDSTNIFERVSTIMELLGMFEDDLEKQILGLQRRV
jgi:hypothetical protein